MYRHLAVAAVVGLGLTLRVACPTLAEFKRDEATVARQALGVAYERDLPSVGVGSSVRMANPPLTLYLLALLLRL